MAAGQRIILVAAGAGAGIAATFNTPIGGVMFAIELMMPEVSVAHLPAGRARDRHRDLRRPLVLRPAAGLLVPDVGAAARRCARRRCLLCSTRVLGVDHRRGRRRLRARPALSPRTCSRRSSNRLSAPHARHAAGRHPDLRLHAVFGHYYVEGVGYATIQAILLGQIDAAWRLLALLFVCKLLATSLSLGSGSSGGIFSPSLFMGATHRRRVRARCCRMLPLPIAINIPAFAMVGMGAMVGGGTGAVMTAVTMIFEMTRDYDIVLPMIVAVALSVGVRRLLSRENIYTLKLFRRGHVIPKALHANMFLVRRRASVMDTDVLVAAGGDQLRRFLRAPRQSRTRCAMSW